MDKQILLHKKFVQEEMSRLTNVADKNSRTFAAHGLWQFHTQKVREFQHERAIHLAVTLFFAVLMLASWVVFAVWFVAFAGGGDASGNANIATLALALLVLMLTILEIFYVAHYYKLENRTQRMYDLDDDIYEFVREDLSGAKSKPTRTESS